MIRISVFDFSSFKGLFVNVGRWWLRLYCGRLVLSGAPLILPQFGPRVSEEYEEEAGGGDIVNLSGGEWGHGVSMKWNTGFLDRGWRIYSHCVDKRKDLTHIWIPPSVCVPLSGGVVSKIIGLNCTIPYTLFVRGFIRSASADLWYLQCQPICCRYWFTEDRYLMWSGIIICSPTTDSTVACVKITISPISSAKYLLLFLWPY